MSNFRDTDSGLGIGGIGGDQSSPFIPSEKTLKRMEDLQKKAKTCRRCKQTDIFDGAMFTNGGINICDDCGG